VKDGAMVVNGDHPTTGTGTTAGAAVPAEVLSPKPGAAAPGKAAGKKKKGKGPIGEAL